MGNHVIKSDNHFEFTFQGIGRLVIPRSSYEALLPFRQIGNRMETGGILAGSCYSTDTWVLSHVMQPSPRDKAGRTWHKRDRRDAQKFVNKVFRKSGGLVNYVGEWHTHPEPHPQPSACDYQMIHDLLRTSRIEMDFLFGLVLGDECEFFVWCQKRTGVVAGFGSWGSFAD